MTQRTKDFIWNTVGSLIYALSSFVLAVIVIRLCGDVDGGVFSFGFSTLGQQLFIVAYFGVRPFHITDVSRKYSFGEYRKLRIISSAAAVAAGILISLIMLMLGKYTPEKALILPFIALYRIFDGYADVYESECQRAGKLYIGGFELAVRTLLVSMTLTGVLALGGKLLTAVICADAVQAAAVLFYRRYCVKNVFAGDEDGNSRSLKTPADNAAGCSAKAEDRMSRPSGVRCLAGDTLFLFLATFLDFFIFSAAKYAVDLLMGSSASSVSGILFMPASIIYLAANFVIRPFLTQLAAYRESGDDKSFRTSAVKIEAAILVITLLAVAAVLLIGRPVLSLLETVMGGKLGGRLSGSFTALLLIVAGGGVYALANMEYYLLVILSCQKQIFAVYAAVTAAAVVITLPFVRAYGITGGAVAFALYMLILFIAFRLIRTYVKKS